MLQFVGKLKLYAKVVPGTACTYSHQNLFVIICRSSSPTKTIFFQYFVQCNPPASCFFVLIMSHQKGILSYAIYLYEKLKNYSIQSFRECLFFVFCLFWFLLLSSNTIHVMFYTYVCYWNAFQYEYIIQIKFHVAN